MIVCTNCKSKKESRYFGNIRPCNRKFYCFDCIDNMIGFYKSKIPNNKKQYVGVELEIVQTRNLPRNLKGWIQKQDGSIIPSSSGAEMVFEKPLTSISSLKQTKKITTIFKQYKSLSNNTCGYHIHLDCTNFAENQIRKFICWCYNVQDSVQKLVKSSRRDNVYCRLILPMNYNESLRNYWNEKMHCNRYYWVNIASYYHKNTVEIRLHHGTVDELEINNWIILWTTLIQFITSTTCEIAESDCIFYWMKKAGLDTKIIDFYKNQVTKYAFS